MKGTISVDIVYREFFTSEILRWGKANFRSFPWREPGTSGYQILVSEVLLRKTRAESIVPVYERLLALYPGFSELAGANQSTLENLLKPLGLFRIRSRALKSIAEEVVTRHGGQLPQDEIALAALPHCGRYIANAILCFHFGEDRAIVDSNVHRLLCRHFGFDPVVEIHKADHMWEFMKSLLPPGKGREFNYAVLDFCSLICTARNPKCHMSPINTLCQFCQQRTFNV
ncbi:MAG: A/G-specific adenine glycosylase [Deltaproteobacteria bacterium]|nr:A/G-specific adenine glycosylase [Deltaproteobacteria bacterium]